jgi:HEAT repeat protein
VSAALVLARLGRRESIDELIQATAYPRVGMVLSKYRAMAALVVLGKSEYLSPLVAGLRNEDPNGRWDAVYAMQSLPDQSMYDANHAAWKGTSNIRSGAFRVLLAVGGSRNRALLREGLADREPAIRLLAAEALLALGRDAASVTVLEQLARDEPRGRVKAFSILTAKGSPRETASVARAVLPTSSNDLRGGQVYDLDNRLVAIHAIEMVRDRESVGALTAIFGMDQSVSSRVAQALIAIGDDASGRALVQAMDHPSSFVRINAAGGVISLYDR